MAGAVHVASSSRFREYSTAVAMTLNSVRLPENFLVS
jgi:hypothetical protein